MPDMASSSGDSPPSSSPSTYNKSDKTSAAKRKKTDAHNDGQQQLRSIECDVICRHAESDEDEDRDTDGSMSLRALPWTVRACNVAVAMSQCGSALRRGQEQPGVHSARRPDVRVSLTRCYCDADAADAAGRSGSSCPPTRACRTLVWTRRLSTSRRTTFRFTLLSPCGMLSLPHVDLVGPVNQRTHHRGADPVWIAQCPAPDSNDKRRQGGKHEPIHCYRAVAGRSLQEATAARYSRLKLRRHVRPCHGVLVCGSVQLM